jgi:hypothetical protein
MLTIGIAVTRDRLLAVVTDGTPQARRVAAEVAVPCAEPFGGPDDPAALAAALRDAVPGGTLPGAVITLPPPLTYLRQVDLPVTDMKRARAIHLAELEGNLPIDDAEILSDLLPPSPDAPGTFVAVAAARSFVEKIVEAFQAAGLRVDLVVTDHAALLFLAQGGLPDDALLLSSFQDILLMRISRGGVRSARQFPAAMADSPAEILAAVGEAAAAGEGGMLPVYAAGDPPASLAAALPGLASLAIPEGVSSPGLAALGAALAPFFPKAAAGFSLRTSAEAAADRARGARRIRIAAVAAGVAALLAVGALQFSVWVSGRKVDKARAQVRREFTEASPDVQLREATAGVQIREKLDSVKRLQKELGTDAPPAADLLAVASKSLPEGDIAVREASVEGGRMRLAGEAGDSRLVEAYRAGLASAFGGGFVVALEGSEGSARGSAVRFTILVEKKEERRAS